MAREKQSYEYVMDVALRATLKEHGFKRKTYATYIRETEDRVWIFELETEPRLGAGFDDMAGVRLPELDRIFEQYAPGDRAMRGVTRTPSHISASLPRLMEIAAGHDYYTWKLGRASAKRSKDYQAAQSDPLMKYQRNGYWCLRAGLPAPEEGEEGWVRYDRRMDELIIEFGQFYNDIWLQYALPWYQQCHDPLFVADQVEKYNKYGTRTYGTLAALCHMGGDNERAANYLRRCFDDAQISYEERYRKLHKKHHRSWWWWLSRGAEILSDEDIAKRARYRLERDKRTAETARKLADGLGIAV
jgi:hypothetical protein